MTTTNDFTGNSVDEKYWRKLCQLVASEADPERLSQLLDQLLQELDARRVALRQAEQQSLDVDD